MIYQHQSDALRLDNQQWLALGRGFSRVFWGLFVSLICFFGDVSICVMKNFNIPAYIAGAIVLIWGLVILRDVGGLRRNWRARINYTIWLVALQIYLAPFVEWWRVRPNEIYFTFNMVALVFIVILSLLSINMIVASVSRALSERGILAESIVYFVLTLVLQLAPVYIIILSALYVENAWSIGFVFYLKEMLAVLPKWLYIAGMIPFSLNMMLVWRIRERCYAGFLDASD